MNILVCVKQVPDTTEIKINPETNTLMRGGVPSILNPFDEFALETALRIKDRQGGSVTVITMGLPQAMDVLKKALSVGADTAYLVSDRSFGGADTLATSYTLATTICFLETRNGERFDLIFCGKQAIDGDTAQVGPEIAEHLGIGQVTYATEVTVEGCRALVKKDTDDGYNILTGRLPLLISVTKTPYELRYATIRGKMEAKRRNIETIASDTMEIDLSRCGLKGSATRVKKSFTPAAKKSGVMIRENTVSASAAKLVSLLNEANIL